MNELVFMFQLHTQHAFCINSSDSYQSDRVGPGLALTYMSDETRENIRRDQITSKKYKNKIKEKIKS